MYLLILRRVGAQQTKIFLRMVSSILESLTQMIKEAAYKGLVHPVLECSGSVWDIDGQMCVTYYFNENMFHGIMILCMSG